MRHHFRRAKHVYETRGMKELAKTTISYIPIEINNFIFRLQNESATRVMEEDWDNLIILDACRYDMFSDCIELDGELQSRISLGSTSEEFLDRNFVDKTFHDTVYINSNPYLPQLNLDERTFHAIIDLLERWDPDLQTVHPQTVVEAAREGHTQFPKKRLIVHFMQPHYPFIGDIGQEILNTGWSTDGTESGGASVWGLLQNDATDLDRDLVWEAYVENLEIVLSHVDLLLNSLTGKTVISADHGNLVGERLSPIPTKPKYGHPYGVLIEELVKVPWFVIESEDRRTIESNPPINNHKQSDKVIEDRLEALGYK